MKFEYQGRFFRISIVVNTGWSRAPGLLMVTRPEKKQDHELRRALWQRSVEAIKNEPAQPDQ